MDNERFSVKSWAVAIVTACIFPLVYLAAQVAVTMVAAIVGAVTLLLGGTTGDFDSIYNSLLSDLTGYMMPITIIACAITVAAVVITLRVKKQNVRDALRLTAPRVGHLLIAFVLGIVLNLTLTFVMALIPIPETVVNDYNEVINTAIYSGGFWLAFAAMGIAAPIAEEVVFRGWSMNRLRRGMPLWAMLLFQSIIFAVVHGNPLQIAYVFPVAVVFGLIYLWSDNLYVAMSLHIGFNMFSVVLSYLPATEQQASDAAIAVAPTVVLASGGLILIALCMSMFYRFYRTRKGSLQHGPQTETD